MNGELWDRQPNESLQAFSAFQEYRDMGQKRAIRKLAEKRKGDTKSKSMFEKWSIKYQWGKRIKAYEDWLDAERQQSARDEVVDMNKRHIILSRSMQDKVSKRLETLDSIELNPDQTIRAMDSSVRLERLARGEAESIGLGTFTLRVVYEDDDKSKEP